MHQLKIAVTLLFFTGSCFAEPQEYEYVVRDAIYLNRPDSNLQSLKKNCVCIPAGLCYNGYKRHNETTDRTPDECLDEGRTCCDPSKVLQKKDLFDETAWYAEMPWMVLVVPVGPPSHGVRKRFFCGGTLIDDKAVLTSAYCIGKYKSLEVWIRAGDWNIDTFAENTRYPYQNRKVSRIVIHPKYNETYVYKDYAILILSDPVDITPVVKVISLAKSGTRFNKSLCFGLGWGANIRNQQGGVLKKIDLPVMSRDKCNNVLNTHALPNIRANEICVGGIPGKDLSTGDSGGPLICKIGNESSQFIQVGVIPWNTRGYQYQGLPTIISSVSFVRGWIDSVLNTYIPKSKKTARGALGDRKRH